jgi:Major Facilitator Superfamily
VTQLRLGTAAGRATLATTVLASGMAFLASTVVTIALPDLGEQLRANLSGLQWIIIGYTLVLAAFALLGAALGEQHGRRRIFLAGVAWFTVASIACGLASNLDLLAVARVLQGAGAALMVPGSLAILQASFVPSDRAAAIGAWSGLSGISVALGPLLGGWLVGTFGWRAVFLLNVPLAVVVLLLGVRYLPESSNPAARHTRSDLAGPLLGALGLAGLTYALIATPKDGFGSFRVWLGFAVGLLGPISLALVERGRRRPGVGISDREGRPRIMAMIPSGQVASRTFALLTLYTFSVYAALGGLVFFLVIQLQTVAGYSATAVGVASLPTTLIVLVGGLGGAALAARIGWRVRLIAGPALCAAGTLLLLNVGPDTVYWRDVLPGTILLGLGLAAFAAPLTSAILAAVARIGQLLAVAALPLLVGLGGAAYANSTAFNHGYHVALWWCAGFLTAGALTALLLRTSEISG